MNKAERACGTSSVKQLPAEWGTEDNHLLNMMQLYSLKQYTSGACCTVTELKPLSKPGRKYKLAEKAHISQKPI